MLNRLFDEIGARPLGLARIIVGSAAVIRLWAAVPEMMRLTDPDVLLTPYGSWAPTPSEPLVVAILVVWAIAALLFTVGWRVSFTGTALTLAIVASLTVDQQTYANHLYLMAWLVLLLTLAGSGSALNLRRSDRLVVRWPVMLLMAQMTIVYAFSAVTKLTDTFLSGSVLALYLGSGIVPFPEALRTPGFLAPLAAVAMFVELFIAFFIWRPRFRPAAFLLGFLLHLAITLSMADTLKIFVFALEMLALYPLFLSQEPLPVTWDDDSPREARMMRRLQRLDVLHLLEPSKASGALTATTPGGDVTGYAALPPILDRLVPTMWVAAVLRLPGIRSLGRRWYRRSRAGRSAMSG